MALLGSSRKTPDWLSVIGDIGRAYSTGTSIDQQRAARLAPLQQEAVANRLRAQLSPADGPNGSGTGAMPSIEDQMRAIDDARLLNPEVAQQFAPVVQSRRLEGLTGDLPLEQRLATMLNPEKAGEAFATQFRDDTLAPGSIRTRGGQTVAAAPTTQRFDDRYGTYDPATGQTTYSQPRGMTDAERIQQQNADTQEYAARTGRISAERPQVTTISPGQEFYGVGPQGQVSPLGWSTQDRPIPDSVRRDNERDEMAISDRAAVIGRIDNAIGLIQNGMISLDPLSRASAWVRNNTGSSSPQSQALAELRRTVETQRNQILNDATGPQTDGDSLRALNQIIAGWGDEKVVMQGLAAYREIQLRKSATQAQIMQNRMAQFGGQQRPPAQAQQPGGQGALEAEARQGGSGPIAVNHQTGERVQWNGSQWVRVQ